MPMIILNLHMLVGIIHLCSVSNSNACTYVTRSSCQFDSYDYSVNIINYFRELCTLYTELFIVYF